jgi:hypothetical protein
VLVHPVCFPDAMVPEEPSALLAQPQADECQPARRELDASAAAHPDAAADAFQALLAAVCVGRSVAPERAYRARTAAVLPEQARALCIQVAVPFAA